MRSEKCETKFVYYLMIYFIQFILLGVLIRVAWIRIRIIIIFHIVLRTYFTSEIMIFKYLIQFQSSHANTTFELLFVFCTKEHAIFLLKKLLCCRFLPLFYQYTKIQTNQWLVTTNKEKMQTLDGRSHYLYLWLD